jgi:hypothetical protein
MSRIQSSRDLEAIIKSLTQQRQTDVGRIESLFDTFGVSAKQDLATSFEQARARDVQDLQRRGLSQTTRATTQRTDLLEKEKRGAARIDEQVAGQKAGFLERQLIDPSLITSLIQQASAVDTTPRQAFVGASSEQLNAPGFGVRPAGQGGGGGGSPGTSSFGFRGGSGGPSGPASIVTREGRFSPAQFAASRNGPSRDAQSGGGGAQSTGARVIPSPTAAPATGTTGQASLRSGQASGSGSIRSTATGTGFETRTGQAQPNAIGAAATDVTAAAGTGASAPAAGGGGGTRSVTIKAGANSRTGAPGTVKTVSIPAGLSNVEAITQQLIPWGWRIVSG